MKIVNFASYTDGFTVAKLRPGHREYVGKLESEGRLVAGGPFKDGSGALFIYEVASLHEAREIVAADPYSQGAFAECQLKEWDIVTAVPSLLPPASAL
jgi:uncharacterized protein YciI